MRYIPIRFAKEGMTLAKPVFGANGNLLLSEGSTISGAMLNRLVVMRYNGVYIEDEISSGIEAKNLICDHLKNLSVQTVKQMYRDVSPSSSGLDEKKIKAVVDRIVEEIAGNDHVMVNLVDLKIFDDYTYFHSVNCTILSLIIGVGLGLDKEELHELGLAAILHDIGKLFVPREILNKQGVLTKDEFAEMKKHSEYGYTFLKEKTSMSDKVCLAVRQHHEKFDGDGGYPLGLKGKAISLYGRILTVADVYDALTSDRSYREAMSPSEAMECIMGNGGRMFDPDVVSVFCRKVAPYPVGTCVQLSNGEVGIITETYEYWGLRPTLEVINASSHQKTSLVYDLRNDPRLRNVIIAGVVHI